MKWYFNQPENYNMDARLQLRLADHLKLLFHHYLIKKCNQNQAHWSC